MDRKFSIVAYGGGLNSTAMVLGLIESGEKIDLVVFSDTGGERPETYQHIVKWSEFLKSSGIPFHIVTNTFQGRPQTLESFCLRKGKLPSVAYGFKTCSVKFKIDPVNKFLRSYGPLVDYLFSGGCETIDSPTGERRADGSLAKVSNFKSKAIRYIGFDAGEERRVKHVWDSRTISKYPLIEWGWYREECAEICFKYGFNPPKSSCFFCPNNKLNEIIDLKEKHPDLFERALKIERGADTRGTIVGLARDRSWAAISRATESCGIGSDLPCGCYDGEATTIPELPATSENSPPQPVSAHPQSVS